MNVAPRRRRLKVGFDSALTAGDSTHAVLFVAAFEKCIDRANGPSPTLAD
jgi:hypothetical protein